MRGIDRLYQIETLTLHLQNSTYWLGKIKQKNMDGKKNHFFADTYPKNILLNSCA